MANTAVTIISINNKGEQKMRSKYPFILFTLFLLCAIWCPHQSDAQTISPGTVALNGLDISSNVTDGTTYVGKREIR